MALSNDAAAAAAAAAAAEAARRRAEEEARRRAEEAARKKAAEAAAKKAAEAAAKKAAAKVDPAKAKSADALRAKKFGGNEFSTGKGSALKAKALATTGASIKALKVEEPKVDPKKADDKTIKDNIEKYGQAAYDGLKKTGLTEDDLAKAAKTALPDLKLAGQAVLDHKYGDALKSLGDAAKAGGIDLAKKAITGLAEKNLSGPAKQILSDPKVVDELAKAAPGTLKKLGDGKIGDALEDLASNKPLRDSVINAALKDPDLAKNVEKLGLTKDDLTKAGAALPNILRAADHASKGEWKEAVEQLANGAKHAPELIAKGIQAAAKNLPPGLARDILTDDKAALAITKAGTSFIKNALDGKPEALRELIGNDSLRGAVIDAAYKNADFKAQIDKLGLTKTELKEAGKAVPHLLDAATALNKQPPDAKAALLALADAAKDAPNLVSKAIEKSAAQLPEGLAKDVLTNSKVADQLAKASPDVLRKLANGDVEGALGAIGTNKTLRDSVIDAAMKNKDFAANLKKLGIETPADLKQAGDALPDLFKAGKLLSGEKPDLPGALAALREAAIKAPDLTDKLAAAVAKNAPQPIKDLLGDPKLAKALITDKDFHANVKKVIDGDVLGGLSGILKNDTIREGVLDIVGKNPAVQNALKKVGLDQADLKQAGAAAPHILDAAKAAFGSPPDFNAALDALGKAADAAPELLKKLGGKIYDALPADLKKGLTDLGLTKADIQQAPLALPKLVEAGKKLTTDPKGAVEALLKAGELAPDLATKFIQGAGNALPEKFGLAKKLLQDGDVAKALASDSSLHESINQLLDGKVLEGASGLLHNDAARDAVLKVVANDPKVQDALGKVGLTKDDLLQAGAAAPHLLDAGVALSKGKWQDALTALGEAGSAAPALLNKIGEKIYGALPKNIQDNLSKLGLTAADFKEAGQALPHVIDAAQAFAAGKPEDALKALAEAVGSAPGLMGKAISTLAKKLPGDGLLKTLLSDPATVSDFLTDPNVRDAAKKLLSGDPAGALRDAGAALREGNDSKLLGHVADAILKDPKLSAALKKIGIETKEDITDAGAAIGDMFSLVDHLGHEQWGDAIKDLGLIAQDLPDTLRSKIVDKLTTTMHLPPALGEVLSGVIDAMGDPAVRDAVGDAFAAFKSGNPIEWIKGLAHAGEVISKNSPDLAVGFLDTLAKLPGSVGAFFGDHELNKAIVDSGSLTHVFTAVEKLTDGDLLGAVKELGGAFAALIGQGDKVHIPGVTIHGPFGIDKTLWGGADLPFSVQGLENIGRLMGRLVEALPPKVKQFLTEKAASAVAKTGFRSIPVVGPVVGLVEDGVDLAQDIGDGRDGLTIGLDIANLVVGGVDLIPGVGQGIATPLKMLLGVANGIDDARVMIGDMKDFGQQMTGMAA